MRIARAQIMPSPTRLSRRLMVLIPATACCVLLAASPLRAQTTQHAIENVLPKMVKIFGAGGFQNLAPYGTGFIVSPQGHIVTVWSHLLDSDQITVVLDDGRRFKAKVLGAEPQLDLAVIRLEADNLQLPWFDLAAAANVQPGTRVLGFSNMFKVATGDEPVSVLHGVVASHARLAARRGRFEIPFEGSLYIIDAITNNSGAAGGVITTQDGVLVGMIGRELRNAESNTWINYAMPVTDLRETVGQIITGNYKSKDDAKVGDERNPRRYDPLDFGLVMVPDVVPRTPAYIDSVQADSDSAKAGLQPDDLVLFVNGKLIQSARTFKDEVGRLEAGDNLEIVVRRGAQLETVKLTVPRKSQ